MTQDKYRPRLSIEISEEQRKELQRVIPWGVRRQLFSILIDDIIRLANKHGQMFIAAVLQRGIKVEDYSGLEVDNPGCDKCVINPYPGKVIPAKRDLDGTWRCNSCGRRLP